MSSYLKTVAASLAGVGYALAAGLLISREAFSARAIVVTLVALLSFLLAIAARKMAAGEIDRVEAIQYGFAVRNNDSDFEILKTALSQIQRDLSASKSASPG